MSPPVVPLDVAVASQDAVPGLQLATQHVQEVSGEVASSVVDLTHYDVSGALRSERGNVEVTNHVLLIPPKKTLYFSRFITT